MRKYVTILFFLAVLFSASFLRAQHSGTGRWNNHKFAVVLTYDDGLDVHLDNVIPVLDSAGLKATFFIPGHSESFKNRMDEWRAVAAEGHELGNHTLFHPCFGKSKNRKWVNPDYDLDNYSPEKFREEITLCNTLLHAVDGKTRRTFAYTCGDREIDSVPVLNGIKDDFTAARGVQKGVNYIGKMDIYNLKIYGAKSVSGKVLIDQVKKAGKNKNGVLLVFLFHGVGGNHSLKVTEKAHRELIRYLQQHSDEIWVAPLVEVMSYYRENILKSH